MKTKLIYKYKIKEGAYKQMAYLLKYPEVGFGIIDNAKCCIFEDFPSKSLITDNEIIEKNNKVYGIKLLDFKISEYAIITPDLLEELPEEEWQ